MISIKNLHKNFNENIVFSAVNLEVAQSEMIMLFGQNGSGKSTLIKCIYGLLKFRKGTISLKDLERNEMGLVLDENLLIPKLRVYEYLSLILDLKCNTHSNQDIDDSLNSTNLIEQKNEFIGNLSKGSKSKLQLISALISKPKLIILDEPFRGMDLVAFEKSLLLIQDFHKEGGTVLLTTHRTGLIENLLPTVMVIKNKKIEKMKDGISESCLIDYLKKAN